MQILSGSGRINIILTAQRTICFAGRKNRSCFRYPTVRHSILEGVSLRHTVVPDIPPGEMVFIDSKTRYLFCADACNRNLLLIQSGDHTEGRYVSVEKAAKAMERIVSMKDQYDHVINSHHDYRGFGAPLADYVVDQALECMKKIVDGTAEIREIPDPLQRNVTKTVAVYGDVFITYSKEGVYETR